MVTDSASKRLPYSTAMTFPTADQCLAQRHDGLDNTDDCDERRMRDRYP